MTKFCIQLQPDLTPEMDAVFIQSVRKTCETLALDKKLIQLFEVTASTPKSPDENPDEAPYLNLVFETNQPEALWSQLQKKLYRDKQLGPSLHKASMTICTGEEGWDDYLLLYHFDPEIEFDTL